MSLFRCFLFLWMISSFFSLVTAIHAAEKPNILLIYTDDQSFNTLAALGHPIVKTPNLDKLAKEGVAFTNTYNQGAWHGAVCVASRSMLNTGRFLWEAERKTKQYSESSQNAKEKTQPEFWSRIMKSAGYTTYFTGKWHVDGVNVQPLFDHVGLVRGGMPATVESSYNRPKTESEVTEDGEYAEDVWNPYDPQFKGHWTGGAHWAESLADSAISFLEQTKQKDEPFFMYVAFNSPHDPRQAPRAFVDMYAPKDMDVPTNFLPENPHKDAMGCPATLRDERLAPYPRTEHAVRVHRREYYAIISHLDAQIGRILAALDKTGKRENTYIFFTADNGLAIGAHGLFGKQSLFEHSAKVPLVVAGPGVPQDKRVAAPVYLQDIVPTSVELAGADIPPQVQFRSLVPLLENENAPHYDAIYGGYMTLQRMVRKGDFKLIVYPKTNTLLLFDLKSDPDETRNLAAEPEHAARVRDLLAELIRLQKDTGDTLDLSGLELPTTPVTQKLPINAAPLPQSEQMLRGDVVRMVETAKLAPQEENWAGAERLYLLAWKKTDERTFSLAWQKAAMDDAAAVPGMTFLMPEAGSFKDVKPYFSSTSRPGATDICFVFPTDKEEMSGLKPWQMVRYDARGRIRDLRSFSLLGLLAPFQLSSFRYEFHYGDESDANCREARLFFNNPNTKTEEEIGYIRLQYEAGRPTGYLSGGASYFFSDKKTELAYDDHGILQWNITYNGHGDDAKPQSVLHYQDHELDDRGNWTRRDVYANGQLLAVETREIEYAE